MKIPGRLPCRDRVLLDLLRGPMDPSQIHLGGSKCKNHALRRLRTEGLVAIVDLQYALTPNGRTLATRLKEQHG